MTFCSFFYSLTGRTGDEVKADEKQIAEYTRNKEKERDLISCNN